MKKIFGFLFALASLASCMKKVDSIEVSNEFASVAVINASPTAAANSTNGNVYVDNVIQTTSAVGYRGSSGTYLSVQPGNRVLRFTAPTPDSARFVERPAESYEAKKSYTVVVYDTVPASQTFGARRLRSFRLTDDISLTSKQANTGYVRVLHLAPNAPAVDVTFLRINAGTPDSVTVTNRTYVGANPTQAQLDALSPFNTTLPLGFWGIYTIRVKQAGTQNVVATLTTNLVGNQVMNQTFVTVYVTGGAQGQAYGVGFFRHYP